jgi:hypothetical protein
VFLRKARLKGLAFFRIALEFMQQPAENPTLSRAISHRVSTNSVRAQATRAYVRRKSDSNFQPFGALNEKIPTDLWFYSAYSAAR